MDVVVIEGLRPWDGRYPLDPDEGLTMREWGWIADLAGYLPADSGRGLRGGDRRLYAALALVALTRHGLLEQAEVPATFESWQDRRGVTITIEGDEQDTDAGPPTTTATSGNSGSSGGGSKTGSGMSDGPGEATGDLRSATSMSAPAMSTT